MSSGDFNWFRRAHTTQAAFAARDRRRALRKLHAETLRNAFVTGITPVMTNTAATTGMPSTADVQPTVIAPVSMVSASTRPLVVGVPPTRTVIEPEGGASDRLQERSPLPWDAEQAFVGREGLVGHETELTSTDTALVFADMADHEYLLHIFSDLKSTRGWAPGPDGLTYADLGASEAAAVMRDIASRLRNREYLPGPSRLVLIPKGGRRNRELRLRCIIDRVVSAALARLLSPMLEQIFLPSSMGFRSNKSVWTVIATIARAVGTTGYAVIT